MLYRKDLVTLKCDKAFHKAKTLREDAHSRVQGKCRFRDRARCHNPGDSGSWFDLCNTHKKEKNMEQKKVSKGKIALGVIALVAIVGLLIGVYSAFGAKAVAGSKDITIEVVNKAAESIVYEVSTDAEFLRQAMEEAEGLTFEGEEGPYGLAVSSVNGEVADFNVDSSYWSFYVNEEYCNYGIDSQPVMDGDAFKIVYTTE